MRDMITPGGTYLDLREIVDERDRILGALRDASAEKVEAEDYKLNTAEDADEDRCSNDCVCTLAERIENDTIVGNTSYAEAVEGWDELLREADVTESEAEFVDQVISLGDELSADLDDYATNESSMIRDSEFEDYARDFAEDIGAVGRDAQWPVYHIDWAAAAEDLKMDYSEVEFGGYTYLIRSY